MTLPVWVWFIAFGVLGAAELLTGSFFMLVLALAALAGAGACFAGLSLSWQIAAASVVAVIGCFLILRIRKSEKSRPSGPDSLDVGRRVEVEAWKADGTARVQYRGAQWDAVAAGGSERAPGTWEIVRVDGQTLVVKPVSAKE